MHWLDPHYHDEGETTIIKPDELEASLNNPPIHVDKKILERILGSMIGLALGDALGAHVEFRPHQYLVEHPVTELQGGGTWGLQQGQVMQKFNGGLSKRSSMFLSSSSLTILPWLFVWLFH
jgi:hypothetical protein